MIKHFRPFPLVAAVLSLLPVAASGALIDRGDGLIYDDILNITWLQDANLAATETFGVSGISSDGSMSLATSNEWIVAMNASSYLGYSNWRLTTARPVNGSTFIVNPPSNDGTTDSGFGSEGISSELRYLYYNNLGNLGEWIPDANGTAFSQEIQAGFGLNNVGPFLNLSSVPYHVVPIGAQLDIGQGYDALIFNFINGLQDVVFTAGAAPLHVWAVRDGDVVAVPLPVSAWGLISGLVGLLGFAYRQTNNFAT